MRQKFTIALMAGLLAACQPSSDVQKPVTTSAPSAETAAADMTESQRINHWFDEKYEEQLQMSPLEMTFLGRKDRYDEFDDLTVAQEKRKLAWQAATVEEMTKQFDYDKLDLEAKTSYDVWLYQYEQARANLLFIENDYTFTQMNGFQAFAAQFLMSFHKVETESDMVAYNKRIGGVARGISELLDRAKHNASKDVRPPRFAYEGVIEQATNLITGAPFTDTEADAPLWEDAKKKVASLLEQDLISDDRAKELEAQAKEALVTQFLPTYNALLTWFKSDMENTDAEAQGAGALPNGTTFYNHMLKARTTTDLTADEIHTIGLSEVDRIYKAMEAIKTQVGFEGTLQEFFVDIKKDKNDERFYYPNTDAGRKAYIDDTEAHYAVLKAQLPNYFGILPKADIEVKRVEAFREQDGAAQHYFPGTPDGSRPGVYYAHLSDMSMMPKNEMEAVAYHEGLPGHHMQISIAQELTSVPQFRTQAGFTAYVEGWGLYSELLAKEMGGYQNAYSDFGRLVTEMWRAVRLVVDTGIHAKGWTEKQANDYFKINTPISDGAIKSEVRRYFVLPGQATAYKIGMLKILELRQYAKDALGDKFDIRGFHDTILGGGALPLGVLQKRVENWVSEVAVQI
ncbi:DUF885 domain-containing protein [Alteromonadaceae bacterium BrNp21-10]|nr:DUF885 domain-containing protein [Alteromonadaceae bacterium BrNp21-10]